MINPQQNEREHEEDRPLVTNSHTFKQKQSNHLQPVKRFEATPPIGKTENLTTPPTNLDKEIKTKRKIGISKSADVALSHNFLFCTCHRY